MSELRRDPIVGRWVIVKTEDAFSPEEYRVEDNTPEQITTSPFCYGREKLTPSEVDAIRPKDTQPDSPGWSVRVVPNKFPALTSEGDLDKRGLGLYDMSNGIGAHEVIIETPDPIKQMADFSDEEMFHVVKMYQTRIIKLSKDKRLQYILIFKNYGQSAGTSIDHAHSQIIALPLIPKYVRAKLDGAKSYFDYRGRSVYADVLKQEYEDRERIIIENQDFIAFCPFAPRYAFECWILPKMMDSRFVELTSDQLSGLALLLKDVLGRIKTCLTNPSYNFYLHISPMDYEYEGSYLWHIEIVPKLTRFEGFEWATGMFVVHTPPSMAAKYLREAG